MLRTGFATAQSHVKIFRVNFLRVFSVPFRPLEMLVPKALGMKFSDMAFRITLVAFHPVSWQGTINVGLIFLSSSTVGSIINSFGKDR